jgi:GTP-binding protein
MNESFSNRNVVVIGRPNVGKSTLFNRLLGRKQALVHHEPGTTRDRNETIISWKGEQFRLIDTGGWAHDVSIFSTPVRKQMETALVGADLVLLLVDGQSGFHSLDAELGLLARKNGKRTILVVNKIDTSKEEAKMADFYRIGIDEVISISANHGINIAELLDMVLERLPAKQELPDSGQQPIHLILVGKPNVGKSSLVNALARQERSIVHDKPGTTREAIDIGISYEGQDYKIIDTPGLHRKHKFTNDMEYLMSLSAHHAMERADVAVIVMDMEQGIGETEAKVAQMVLDNRKACLLAVNKWDLVEDREGMVKFVREQLEQKLKFLSWCKVIFISAKSSQRIERILTEAKEIYATYSSILPAQELKDTIRAAETHKPFSRQGHVLRIKEVRQVDVHPPVIQFVVNDPQLVHFSYRRYLENCLRAAFKLDGTPIVLKFSRFHGDKVRYEE